MSPADLTELLVRGAAPEPAPPPTAVLWTRGRLGRRRKRAVAIGSGLAVIVLGSVVIPSALDRPAQRVEIAPADEILGAPRPAVVLPDAEAVPAALSELEVFTGSLVVATRDGSATFIDVDRRTSVSRKIPELAAGDPPERLIAGNRIVFYGGDTTYAMDARADAEPEPIVVTNGFSVFVPSGVPDRFWVRPGRTDGAAAPIQQVDMFGNILIGPAQSPGGNLALGLRDQVVLQGDDGLIVWDPKTDEILMTVDGVFPMGTDGRRFAWCDQACQKLYLTDPTSGVTTLLAEVDDDAAFSGYIGRMSPDGNHLAVPVCKVTSDPRRCALVVIDIAEARSWTVGDGWIDWLSPAWSPDGKWVFARLVDGRLGAYSPGNGELMTVAVDALPPTYGLGVVTAGVGELATVPDVEGLTLAQARASLARAGLDGSSFDTFATASGEPTVAHQEPAAGAMVAVGAMVGLRTAVISPEVCAIMLELPARAGDARDFAATDGFWPMLRRLEGKTQVDLGSAVEELLVSLDRGDPVSALASGPLERVTVAADACHAEQAQR